MSDGGESPPPPSIQSAVAFSSPFLLTGRAAATTVNLLWTGDE